MEEGRRRMKPKHWPAGLVFLTRSVEYESMKIERALQLGESLVRQPHPLIQGLSGWVKILEIDESHPAWDPNAQSSYGLFARRDIAAGVIIGEYVGVLESPGLADTSRYKYGLGTTDIDAEEAGNETRFINDYRGTNREANVKFMHKILLNDEAKPELAVVVETLRDINRNEELLVDYGPEYWENLGHISRPQVDGVFTNKGSTGMLGMQSRGNLNSGWMDYRACSWRNIR